MSFAGDSRPPLRQMAGTEPCISACEKNFKKILALDLPTNLVVYRNHSTTVEIRRRQMEGIMKRYTLRMLIHDAKVFNQLRLEYRRAKKSRRKNASADWLSRYLGGTRRRARA